MITKLIKFKSCTNGHLVNWVRNVHDTVHRILRIFTDWIINDF